MLAIAWAVGQVFVAEGQEIALTSGIMAENKTFEEIEEQRKSFEVAAMPLIEWLDKNFHPHVKVIVTGDSAELVEGLAIVQVGEEV